MTTIDKEFDNLMDGSKKKPEEVALSSFYAQLPEWVAQAVIKGIKLNLVPSGVEVDGFYRNGTIIVSIAASGACVAVDKKGHEEKIENFDDLVRLNYDWWKKSRAKKLEWMSPGKEWMEDFIRLNLVKRQVTFIPGDE